VKTIPVSFSEANQRVDKYLKKYLNNAPLSFIYKLFRKKDVKINGHWVKENYILQTGDELTIYVSDEQLQEFNSVRKIEKVTLNHPIIYEDENILLINKPRGLLVHGDISEKRLTLTNEVLNYLYFKGEYDPNQSQGFTPAPAHRLDRNTSGIVVYAKNLIALQELEKLFKDKNEIKKEYQALVVGHLDERQEINKPLLKDEKSGLVKVNKAGKEAITIVEPLKYLNGFTLVNIIILTGRTHQIRVHLSSIGYPVVGDAKYGDFRINKEFRDLYKFENQWLHAYRLTFLNVGGLLSYLKNKTFIASLNKKEDELLKKLLKE